MTAYAAACQCGWTAGPVGNPRRKGGLRDRVAAAWVSWRERLHHRRCRL